MPTAALIRSGYLIKGSTVFELAQRTGIDPEGLQATLEAYNAHAVLGEDPKFGRGSTAFNRYLADPAHTPNPNVAPRLPIHARRKRLRSWQRRRHDRNWIRSRICGRPSEQR